MKNEINAVLENMTTTIPEPEDYTGEDGLLYCGKCRKPKEAYFAPDKAAIFGRDRHPAECDCQRTAREEREAAEKRRRHLDTVEELKRRGFTDPTMRDWTFENDNGRNPQTGLARRYVEHWEDMRTDNIGCLFWGGVGTGKSYLAGCIANALMEKEIPVRMTNFALILNDLAASFEGRNEYISSPCFALQPDTLPFVNSTSKPSIRLPDQLRGFVATSLPSHFPFIGLMNTSSVGIFGT